MTNNKNNSLYENVLLPFLQGASPKDLQINLKKLLIDTKEDALKSFNIDINLTQQELILNHYTLNADRQALYLQEYNQWLKDTNLSNKLIHFLEFLAQEKSPRLRYFLKQVHLAKINSAGPIFYTSIFLISITNLSFLYFLHPNWLKHFDNLTKSLSNILKIALKTNNLAFFILNIQIFKYIYEVFYLLSNNATTQAHKTNKLLRKTFTTLANISAQALIAFSYTIIPRVANYLLILSELINISFSAWTLFNFNDSCETNQNSHPQLEELLVKNEQKFYYLKKTVQLKAECLSLVLIFSLTIINFLINTQFPIFSGISLLLQFIISQVNTYFYCNLEEKYTVLIQEEIHQTCTFSP